MTGERVSDRRAAYPVSDEPALPMSDDPDDGHLVLRPGTRGGAVLLHGPRYKGQSRPTRMIDAQFDCARSQRRGVRDHGYGSGNLYASAVIARRLWGPPTAPPTRRFLGGQHPSETT